VFRTHSRPLDPRIVARGASRLIQARALRAPVSAEEDLPLASPPQALLLALAAFGGAYPGQDEVIGAVRTHQVREGESLIEIARGYDLGFNEIAAANPGLDAFVPPAGAKVVVPTAWIVPRRSARGTLVINLSEMRLYLSVGPDREGTYTTFTLPVGIGSEGAATPPGEYRVAEKEVRPRWHVPRSIREERPDLPEVVPPGPDNPLGSHALRLSARSIMIHGTNEPFGVGRKVSHGCIRLYPEDIPWLFRLVGVGVPVSVIREPVKVGLDGDRVFVEAHAEEGGRPEPDYSSEARRLLAERGVLGRVSSTWPCGRAAGSRST